MNDSSSPARVSLLLCMLCAGAQRAGCRCPPNAWPPVSSCSASPPPCLNVPSLVLAAELLGRSLYIDVANSGASAAAKAVKPVEGCWFCLSNPNADVELVASVGEAFVEFGFVRGGLLHWESACPTPTPTWSWWRPWVSVAHFRARPLPPPLPAALDCWLGKQLAAARSKHLFGPFSWLQARSATSHWARELECVVDKDKRLLLTFLLMSS